MICITEQNRITTTESKFKYDKHWQTTKKKKEKKIFSFGKFSGKEEGQKELKVCGREMLSMLFILDFWILGRQFDLLYKKYFLSFDFHHFFFRFFFVQFTWPSTATAVTAKAEYRESILLLTSILFDSFRFFFLVFCLWVIWILKRDCDAYIPLNIE